MQAASNFGDSGTALGLEQSPPRSDLPCAIPTVCIHWHGRPDLKAPHSAVTVVKINTAGCWATTGADINNGTGVNKFTHPCLGGNAATGRKKLVVRGAGERAIRTPRGLDESGTDEASHSMEGTRGEPTAAEAAAQLFLAPVITPRINRPQILWAGINFWADRVRTLPVSAARSC
ncbi:hypothetical protein BaRGS_00002286 [Batillaria attramentaria]|uniref:Uncharacterized protein n=1 Tax=Batillaria attramentaria TaxID=370345 RepID=A0ABD0M2X6_9CAEN